jgi:hypothetical protein
MRVTDHNNTLALYTLMGSNYCKYEWKRDADAVTANPAKKKAFLTPGVRNPTPILITSTCTATVPASTNSQLTSEGHSG